MSDQGELPVGADEMTAAQIDGLLHQKHDEDPWYYFSQLREKTGVGRCRTIDGFAINVWPSKLRAIAYEIKVSRSDFMNEIDDPEKRAPFVEASSEFYYVVPHGLIQPGEVPKECGLMWAQAGPKAGRVIRKKVAPQRQIDSFPALFVANILRQFGDGHGYDGQEIFHLAGEELTLEDLQEEIDERASEMLVKKKRKIRREAKEEELEKNKKARHIGQFILRHSKEVGLGSRWNLDVDDLDDWLDQITRGEAVPSLSAIRRMAGKIETLSGKIKDEITEPNE